MSLLRQRPAKYDNSQSWNGNTRPILECVECVETSKIETSAVFAKRDVHICR